MTKARKLNLIGTLVVLSHCANLALSQETIIVQDTVQFHSTYSPEVLHQPGWDRYRMYYGSNDGTGDRIYLAEGFGQNGNPPDGINNWQIFGGSNPTPILQPGGTNEAALIHDPTVVHNAGAGVWLMYYTGTSDFGGNANRIFQATSPDGVNWTKQGELPLPNINSLVFSDLQNWGYGNPSLLRMQNSASDDKLYLYFTGSPKTFGQGNGKLYASSLDLVADPNGRNGWSTPVEIASFVGPNPDPYINPQTGQLEILFDAVTGVTYNDQYSDLETYKTVMKAQFTGNNPLAPLDINTIEPFWFARPDSSFAIEHGGTPSYRPEDGLLYVAGNPNPTGFFFNDADLAVVECASGDCLPDSGVTPQSGGPYSFDASTLLVQLSAAGSSNVFGNSMTYKWRVNGNTVANGENASLSLVNSGLSNTADGGLVEVSINAHIGTLGIESSGVSYNNADSAITFASSTESSGGLLLAGQISDPDLVVNSLIAGFEKLDWEFDLDGTFGGGFLSGQFQGFTSTLVNGTVDPYAVFGGSGVFTAYLNVRDIAGQTTSLPFSVTITPIVADFDDDGDVDAVDLQRLQTNFGLSSGAAVSQGDADADADVDGKDFLTWQRQLTANPLAISASQAVPEPSTGFMLICFLLVFLKLS